MRKEYGKSRCGVFHFAYWIPLGQVHPCLSADTCPSSYRHTAVARFLKSTWGFQQRATDLLRIIAPKVASRYLAAIDKVRSWDPGFHLFGNTSYFGMAVVHNLQVGLHTDGGDDKYGFIVMTPFGEYEGAHLVIGDVTQGYWTLAYPPGSYVIFRSSCMEHAITPFLGDRTAVVLFTKGNALGYVERNEMAPDPYLADAGLETDPDEE